MVNLKIGCPHLAFEMWGCRNVPESIFHGKFACIEHGRAYRDGPRGMELCHCLHERFCKGVDTIIEANGKKQEARCMTQLCIRQHIEQLPFSYVNEISTAPLDKHARKNAALRLLRDLLQGIDQHSIEGGSFKEAKGCDASALIKFSQSGVITLLGIREVASGADLNLIIEQRGRKIFSGTKSPETNDAEAVRLVVDSNFSRLFHAKANWISRTQFEESFEQ